MTGLEKIIGQIESEGSAAAEEKIECAKKQADEILNAARVECEQIKKQEQTKREIMKNTLLGRIDSAVDMDRRTALLRAKQQLIADVIDKAYEQIANADVDVYFALMEKMLRSYAEPQSGKIYFSKADIERMPADFKAKIDLIAKEKGGSLELVDACREIDNGFVLVYEGTGGDTSIEENCTLKAMFEVQKEELQDIVHKKLFTS